MSEAFERAAGILLHPTSLPGPDGIGAFGDQAHHFADALADSGVKLWQILPLGPVSYGNSPYSAYSSFAGNPLLISIESLVREKWIQAADAPQPGAGDETRVDFDAVSARKSQTLRICFKRFKETKDAGRTKWFHGFREANASWLEDYALFMALKEELDGAPWNGWPKPLRLREESALADVRERLADEIEFHAFVQFLFDRQWQSVRAHCAEKGVRIIGDVPIFVALDSADVWTRQDLFFLDAAGQPTVVAGVPPDYFCPTGQLWGNPLYDWKAHQNEGYSWWLSRLESVFRQVDIVRIDHFRGLDAYWEVPAGDKTAENGTWKPGPGADFLAVLSQRLGDLPVIAEDLGTITESVHELRKQFNLPGMRVLQFGFGDENPRTAMHAPHNHDALCVAYTGTHDNDTTASWFHGEDREADTRSEELRERERRNFLEYVGAADAHEPHWKMIRACLASVADLAIIPVQDVLGLGGRARMNRPGLVRADNWSWRLSPEEFDAYRSREIRDRLRGMLWRYGRLEE